MRAYDMENVSMKRRGIYLSLEVPGLAERRPSLVHGDFIFVRHAYDDGTDHAYQVLFSLYFFILSDHFLLHNCIYV